LPCLGIRILDSDRKRIEKGLLRMGEADFVLGDIRPSLCGIEFDLHLSNMHEICIMSSDPSRPANLEGNRPAALTVTEDQSMNRRVRLTVRLGGNERSFRLEMHDVRWVRFIDDRRFHAPQELRRNIPMMSVVGDHSNRLAVVTGKHSNDWCPTLRLKGDAIADSEFEHLRVRLHMVQETKAFDDAMVQVDEFCLG